MEQLRLDFIVRLLRAIFSSFDSTGRANARDQAKHIKLGEPIGEPMGEPSAREQARRTKMEEPWGETVPKARQAASKWEKQ